MNCHVCGSKCVGEQCVSDWCPSTPNKRNAREFGESLRLAISWTLALAIPIGFISGIVLIILWLAGWGG